MRTIHGILPKKIKQNNYRDRMHKHGNQKKATTFGHDIKSGVIRIYHGAQYKTTTTKTTLCHFVLKWSNCITTNCQYWTKVHKMSKIAMRKKAMSLLLRGGETIWLRWLLLLLLLLLATWRKEKTLTYSVQQLDHSLVKLVVVGLGTGVWQGREKVLICHTCILILPRELMRCTLQ